MTRHINLMQPDMLPGHGRVQLPTFLVTLTLTLIGCALVAGYHWSIQRSLASQIEKWQARVAISADELKAFRQAHPSMASEADLLRENQALSEQLIQRGKTLGGLTDQLGEASLGFSTPLASLSNYDLDGLWLSRIVLRDSQKHLNLEGFARHPDLIPKYLDQLEGSIFDGVGIQNLRIQQQSDNPALWQFSIADRLEPVTALQGDR